MGDGIYTALTGAIAQQQQLDIVANNVANAQTAGYRGDRVVFGEMVRAARAAQTSPSQPKEDRFVTVEAVVHDNSIGLLKQTGNKLDLALQGDGFFVVRTAQGDRLTRAGNFMMRGDGALTSHDGGLVIGNNGEPINIPTNTSNVQFSRDGEITADGQVVGHLLIGQVADPQNLEKAGGAYFMAPKDGKLVQPTSVEVHQGYIEQSNVSALAGLSQLIAINRSFDAIQKTIETLHKLEERAARELGAHSG
jgi:flagellar basal-body rod protein FlgF